MKSKTVRISMLLMLVCVTATGCISPRQDVPTYWDKWGIPQSFVAIRDHFTNQSGEKPWTERKPRVLRIADAANLESANAAIKAAAEIKKEEDLARQKIKALKYLGKIGCGCYDESGKVEAALMAGLSDCTPAVRMAAIEAVREALCNCNVGVERDRKQDRQYLRQQKRDKKVAARQEKREERLAKIRQRGAQRRAQCGMCGGHGCDQCIECTGCMDMGCDVCIENCDPCGCNGGCNECMSDGCSSCNSCVCCTEKIQKKLADVAFGKLDNGCWKEPVASIRAAAEAVLCLCPAPECEIQEVDDNGGGGDDSGNGVDLPPELKKKEGEGDDGEGNGEGGTATDSLTYSFNRPTTNPQAFGAPITQAPAISNPAPITSIDEFGQPQPTLSKSQAPAQSTGWNGSNAPVIESDVIENDPNMISATISAINNQSQSINVAYDKEFMLPKGAKIVVRDLAGNDIEMVVESSTPGSAEAKASSPGASLPATSSVQIGVVSL